jgi:cellulose synthase/poly-beta-1,6-N-acetylglucosamine synthase-like glycosyltransferase
MDILGLTVAIGAMTALAYVYIGYPLLLWLVAAFSTRQLCDVTHAPRISLLIAAYNEEQDIARKLEESLQLDYPADRVEILVLSDASTDRTDEIVSSFADPRIRLVRSEQRRGKTGMQNLGARESTGEVLVFSDATATYHGMALRYLAANFADSRVGAVSGRYQYFDKTGTSATSTGMMAFWNYENWIKQLQSRIASISGCCGCIYSIRKSAYTALAEDVISDLVQPLWVLKQGMRVVFEPRALAYEQTTHTTKEEFSMRVRVITRGMRGLLSVPDLLNPFRSGWVAIQLLSHKVLRWFVPILLIMLLAGSVDLWLNPLWRCAAVVQLVFYGFAALSARLRLHRLWKPFSIPVYFCTVNLAALRSLIDVIRGRRYVTWQTVRS